MDQQQETLIRVEQQLQDSIKNQSLILSDLKELFSKIEVESKATTAVRSDLSSHIEMSAIRREESERRIKIFEEKIKEVVDVLNEVQNNFSSDLTQLKNELLKKLEEEGKNRVEEIQKSKIFQEQITTTINVFKWLIGILFVGFTAFWPVFIFFKPHP